MAHHEVLDTNPKKELMTAVLGIGLFLALVLGIVVSAYLRPAGDHYPASTEVATAKAATEQAPQDTATADGATLATPNATQSAADTTAPVNTESSTTSPATARAEKLADAPKGSPMATDAPADNQAAKTDK